MEREQIDKQGRKYLRDLQRDAFMLGSVQWVRNPSGNFANRITELLKWVNGNEKAEVQPLNSREWGQRKWCGHGSRWTDNECPQCEQRPYEGDSSKCGSSDSSVPKKQKA